MICSNNGRKEHPHFISSLKVKWSLWMSCTCCTCCTFIINDLLVIKVLEPEMRRRVWTEAPLLIHRLPHSIQARTVTCFSNNWWLWWFCSLSRSKMCVYVLKWFEMHDKKENKNRATFLWKRERERLKTISYFALKESIRSLGQIHLFWSLETPFILSEGMMSFLKIHL